MVIYFLSFRLFFKLVSATDLGSLDIHAEIMDFGYPQNLSPEILKLYITQEGVRSPFSSKVFFVITVPFFAIIF